MNFTEATRVHEHSDGQFRVDVPDGWQQGRGAFGGLSIAFGVRAMQQVETQLPLRVVSAELPGPLVTGEARVSVSVLRRGKGTTFLEAHVSQQEEVRARVSGVFGRARDDRRIWQPQAPVMTPWDAVTPLDEAAPMPPFARAFEYRLDGPAPFNRGQEALAAGWIKLRDAQGPMGPAEVVALADAYWPSAFAMEETFRPMATVAFTLHLHNGFEPLGACDALYYKAFCEVTASGYQFEQRQLWTADGQLVAVNPQTFVVIK